MCGIVGTAGSLYKPEKDAFQDMLVFSQVRGPHSTGVLSIDRKDNEPILCKVVGRPDLLIDYDKRYDRAMNWGKKFILGHNRWATMGKVNKKNAHPFLFSNIAGCHNGTVSDFKLRGLPIQPTDFDTDSECILANMNEHALNDVFSKLDGAWAFVWFDSRNDTVNMLRNSQRDLFYVYTKDRKTMFWASEIGFIKTALNRNRVDFGEVHVVDPDLHYSWEIPKDANKEFGSPKRVAQKGEVHQSWSARFPDKSSGGGSTVYGGGAGELDGANEGVYVVRTDATRSDKRHIIGPVAKSPTQAAQLKLVHNQLPNQKTLEFARPELLKNMDGQGYLKKHKNKDFYRGFHGETLSKGEFDALTKGGCSWCTKTAEWGQPIRFLRRDEHLCLECNSDPLVVQYVGTGSK